MKLVVAAAAAVEMSMMTLTPVDSYHLVMEYMLRIVALAVDANWLVVDVSLLQRLQSQLRAIPLAEATQNDHWNTNKNDSWKWTIRWKDEINFPKCYDLLVSNAATIR